MSYNIKIISYNICAIPWWGNIFGDPIDRVNKIIDFLKKTDADIICLQEVFDEGVLFIIKTTLPEYNFFTPEFTKNFLNSGLVICCKNKIIKKKFEKFKIYCGEDRFSDKGFMYVNIKIKKKNLTIVNTHLNANAVFCTYNYCDKIRMQQMEQLLERITTLNAISKQDIIFCGDFNIDFSTNTGKKIYKKILETSRSCINSKKMITFEDDNIQYDQIFYIPRISSSYKCKYSVYDSGYKMLSDHYPIELQLVR